MKHDNGFMKYYLNQNKSGNTEDVLLLYYGSIKKELRENLDSFCFGDNMAREFSKSFYNSKEWQKCRDYVLKRDNYLCTKCGNLAEEVHHIIHLSPDNIMNPKITLSADNLTCLCKDCHFAEHRDNSKEHLNEYEFDSNGYLVRKEAPL